MTLGREHGHLIRVDLVLFLVFHAPILEPNFDLSLGERQIVRYLNAPPSSQVLVKMKLLLELQRLVASISLSCSLVARAGVWLPHPGVNLAIAGPVALLFYRFHLL